MRSVPRQPSFKSKYNTHSSLNKSVRFSASSKEKDEGFEGMCQLDRLHIWCGARWMVIRYI